MYQLTVCVVMSTKNNKYVKYIETISPYYDELILISSSDEPININNNLYNMKFFSVSQLTSIEINKALEQATGDWVLWLHEGEHIDDCDLHRLRDWLYKLDGQLGLTQVISIREHITGLFKHSDAPVPRLFKKGIKFEYYSSQVELLDYSSIDQKKSNVQLCGLKIYNACLPTAARNINNSLKELERITATQSSIFSVTYYQCAYECYKWQKYSRAIQFINQAIFQFANKNEVPPAYFYKLKYACLIEQDKDADHLKGLKLVLQLYPNHTELNFYVGILNYKLNRYVQARQYFFRCLELGNQANELCKKGAGTFLSSFYIGLCYEKEKDNKQAIHYYSNALLINPSYKMASKALDRVSNNPYSILQ